MKNSKRLFIFFAFFIALKITSQVQVNFTISPSFCVGDITTVSSNMSSASIYSWAALPSGPVFSSPSASITNISFPVAGTYTIGHGVLTGTGYSYTTHIVVVNASPVLAITGSSAVCPGQSATLTASGATTYTWAPAGSLNTGTGATVIASPSTSTNYSITGGIGSCTASATHSITFAQFPVVSVVASQNSVCAGFSSTLVAFGASSYTWTGSTLSNPSFQQSVSVGAGQYTVVGSNGGNCTNSAVLSIGFLPNLSIQVTQSSPTTCITSNFPSKISKPVTLTASGAGTYTWFPFNAATMTYSIGPIITVRPTSTTCFTVMGSTAVCSGSAVSCVSVIPQFSASISPSAPPVICSGDVVSLSVVNISGITHGLSSLFSYFWYEPVNAPPISMSSYFTQVVNVFPQNTCTYTMEVKDMYQCASLPDVVTVSVTTCTGINETDKDLGSLQLYPNPANDVLYINLNRAGQINIEILDALGKVILTQTMEGNSVQTLKLPISAGVYFVKTTNANYSEVRRLIKE